MTTDPSAVRAAQKLTELADAAERLALLDFDHWPGHLTCDEAETIADVIWTVDPERAGAFLVSHSYADDDGDDHGPAWQAKLAELAQVTP